MLKNPNSTPAASLHYPGEVSRIDPDFSVGGDVSIDPDFSVDGGFPIDPDFSVGGDTTIDPDFSVDGDVSIDPDFSVGGIGPVIVWPRAARVRFLNAAYGYRALRIRINNFRAVNFLSYASISAYGRAPAGYQTVTVTGMDGSVYIHKTMPFQPNTSSTIAIINTAGRLDLLQIPDSSPATYGNGNLRVSNLAYNSGPLDVLLGDGRMIYADVRFKETTVFKRIRPGAYQLFFAETNLMPMAAWQDIETMDPAYLDTQLALDTVASLYLTVQRNTDYTVFILSSGAAPNAVQAIVVENR